MENVKLIDTIIERHNRLDKVISELKNSIHVYIYGAGISATLIKEKLEENHISVKGSFVDREYYRGEPNVRTTEELFNSIDRQIIVIVACNGYSSGKLDKYTDKIEQVVCIDNSVAMFPLISYRWIQDNEKRLQKFYESLEDDRSKETISAFLNQKVCGMCGYLSKVRSEQHQYFENDIIDFIGDEVFVDCGAYIGDTSLVFIDELKKRAIDDYKKIVCFEPDEMNFRKLQELNIKKSILVNKGVSDQAGIMMFSQVGDSTSAISETGDILIETDTIDNVLNGEKATFIKMDIEGAELSALKGAAETIKKYKPTLAICIYHKKEDLFEIPEYIHSLVPEYEFYCRGYFDYSLELVLYAISPKNKKA